MSALRTQPKAGKAAPAAPRRRRLKKWLTFDRISFLVVFLGIPVAIYAIFVVSPFVQAFNYSLTNWSGFSPDMDYIGLSNYTTIFADDKFTTSLRNSIVLLIVLPLVTVVLALILASFVTVGGSSKGQIRGLRNSSFYRVISFFPYVVPAIVIGLIWGQVYDPSAGLINGILTNLGFDGFKSFAWLGTQLTALPATMFVIVWGLVGFYMVLFVAAIKGIPSELYEAARIDGAGRFRTLVTITIPLIRDNIQTAYIYMGILALDAFVYMQALEPGGGPNNSTLVISQELFQTAFTKGKFGEACAMGVVLAIITLIFSAVVFMVNRFSGGTNEAAE
ncbi:carbohydrate ABC transporter permease [Spelaeicoccus albus]|uniref:N-acetylglucosamine transport system permease protein n=1 Tax=Spelaeicoccus albus TaxID=1280376 RepID=A0A7Z0AA96_9MICO|nr:sugar ABC transporter permease [Spelaeicoccus albus]NYI67289.1 N-acetylglucosamine transport system permease protein [Spelaeicoccus albus]